METQTAHILVVDDDTRLRALLQRFLRESGFLVSAAKSAAEARMMLKQYVFSLLVVDIMMPEESGLSFLSKLRQEDRVPVILLTAMGEAGDRIAGLETGADDYMPKPFEPKELVLRIKNILRRTPAADMPKNTCLNFGSCRYDMETRELTAENGKVIHITPVEQALLSLLGHKSGQVFSRDRLAELLGAGQGPRSIDVQITRLRKKIEKDSKNPRYLQTIRGKGYMLLAE